MDPTRKKSSSSSFPDPSSAHHNHNHNHKHKHKHSNPPPPRADTRLQAKAMTVSLIAADSPNPFIVHPKPKHWHTLPTAKMDETKEKPSHDRRHIKKVVTVAAAKDKESQQGHGHHDIITMGRPSVSLARRRRSFCSSQVELAGFLASTGVKVVSVDMPPFMQIHAVDCARNAYDSLEKFTSKTLAFTLKKEFDGVYGPAWHCIVGTNFGSFVTHSVGGFMYFALDHKLYILLFKTTVERADRD